MLRVGIRYLAIACAGALAVPWSAQLAASRQRTWRLLGDYLAPNT